MANRTKHRTEIADVPGVGNVAATIGYVVLANGHETSHFIQKAIYTRTRQPVEQEHMPAVGRTFNAFV